MLALDDPHWPGLLGGYRLPFDPRPSILAIEADPSNADAWDDLWENLHHQGDVGEASYAALVSLVDLHGRVPFHGWNLLALAATIETERHAPDNPAVPGWLAANYSRAWTDLLEIGLSSLRSSSDPLVIQSALAVVAIGRGQAKLGALLARLDSSEIEEWVGDRIGWPS